MDFMLGMDDFGEAVRSQIRFVDKSLFVKEIIDRKAIHVPVIIRPRRFGKTFNLSMLHHFLAAEVNGQPTQGLFDGLKIDQAGDRYRQEQGRYPVVSITFKRIKESQFEAAYAELVAVISEAYSTHDYLCDSPALADYEKEIILQVLRKDQDPSLLKNALYYLTHYLYKHHGVKPWLLIDEYDTPIQSAYVHHFYEPMIELMRGIFGNALKGNPNIHRAVVTGILRIAKEGLFSGVNNLEVYSVLSPEYSEYFGFTEGEVDEALRQASLSHQAQAIKAWYNGYQIGDQSIYNPWSIAKCINKKGALQPYWVNTSDNVLIKQSMVRATATVKQQFESLLQGESIQAMIDENMVFNDLTNSDNALWNLMLFAGYLTASKIDVFYTLFKCTLRTPNEEVSALFHTIIYEWFTQQTWSGEYHYLLQSLVQGDVDRFTKSLQKFLLESASYFDVKGTEPERFYHGLVMGLIISLAETHSIHSNKESGYGRYDVMIIPKDKQQLGIVIEFKVADSEQELKAAAEQALKQIEDKAYAAQLHQQGIQRVLKLGLGFYGKAVAVNSLF